MDRVATLKAVLVALLMLTVGAMIVFSVDASAAGGTTAEKRLSLVSQGTERLEGSEILIDGNFWIWSNYDTTTIEYTWGDNESYSETTHGTRLPRDVDEFITFHEGGHLVITAEGETIWEGDTYEDTAINAIRYNWGVSEWPYFLFVLLGVLFGGGYKVNKKGLVERRAR